MSIEADLKRDAMYVKFKEEEAERNRQHELRLAEIYARAMARSELPMSNQWAPQPTMMSPHHPSYPAVTSLERSTSSFSSPSNLGHIYAMRQGT